MAAVAGGGGADVTARDAAVVAPDGDPAGQPLRVDAEAVDPVRGGGVEQRGELSRSQQPPVQQGRVEAVEVGERRDQLARGTGRARVQLGDVREAPARRRAGVGPAVRGGQGGAAAGEGGAGEAEGGDDPAADLRRVGVAGDAADDEAEDGVVGVGVRVGARGGRRTVGGRGVDGRRGGEGVCGGVVGVVVQAAGVAEQGAQGDAAPVVAVAPDQPGEVALDRVREPEPLLTGELEDDDGDERLGDAACPEAVRVTDAGPCRTVGVPGRAGRIVRQERRVGGVARAGEPGEVGGGGSEV